jgi:hypothetical protein
MPHLTFPIALEGYVLPVMIGLDGKTTASLVSAGQPVPAPLSLRGLIDTASDMTCVVPRIPLHFGLTSVGQATTNSIGGGVQVRLFDVSFSIPGQGNQRHLLVLDRLRVMELPQPLTSNIEVLIGMDVLSACLWVADGPNGQFLLSV